MERHFRRHLQRMGWREPYIDSPFQSIRIVLSSLSKKTPSSKVGDELRKFVDCSHDKCVKICYTLISRIIL